MSEDGRGEQGSSMNDVERYMRWLEEMWDVHRFDLHGSTEPRRREKKKFSRCSGVLQTYQASCGTSGFSKLAN